MTPAVRDILKILLKRGEIAPKEQFLLFSTIFCYLLLDFHLKTGTRFSLRDKVAVRDKQHRDRESHLYKKNISPYQKPCTVCFTSFTGFGGQIDFIRGAALSLDGEGKPIIACTSTTDDGTSRIVPVLKLGKFSFIPCPVEPEYSLPLQTV